MNRIDIEYIFLSILFVTQPTQAYFNNVILSIIDLPAGHLESDKEYLRMI